MPAYLRSCATGTLDTWSCERRVVAKAEHLSGGENPRFIVTSFSVEQWAGRELYEQGYCARGEMENRIKEQQLNLFADRTSSHQMRANQLRLYFASFAYVLMHALRRLGLAGDGACARAVRDDSREGAQDWSADTGERSQGVVVDV